MNSKLDFKTAMQDVLPTTFGYLGIGIAFGIIGQASGLSIFLIGLISLITYAGSAQFVLVSMLLAHAPLASIVLAIFLVNSRMFIMSLSVAPYFKKESLLKNLWLGTLLTDESFALSMNKLNYTQNQLSFTWFNTANIVAYLTWFIASIIGGLVGNFIPNPQSLELQFAIVAMFIGLLYLQVESDQKLSKKLQLTVIGLVLILMYIGLIFLPSNILIIIVTLIGCSLGVVIKNAFN